MLLSQPGGEDTITVYVSDKASTATTLHGSQHRPGNPVRVPSPGKELPLSPGPTSLPLTK